MAKFITRVELHGASSSDYEALHGFMAMLNFRRTISADDGCQFILPTATYYSFGDITAEDVRALATAAAYPYGPHLFGCWSPRRKTSRGSWPG